MKLAKLKLLLCNIHAKFDRHREPVEPYQLPVDVDAILPSEGLSLPGFSEEVYTQDVFAIFAANPANKPRLAEIHTGWFNCRGPSLEELWASRYPSGGTYQQTLPNASLRKVVTLQQLLEVASEIPLIRRLRLLLLDHLVLMGVIFTKWDLPLHHFPDFETRIRSLIEALGPQAPLASDTGSIGAAGGLTTSKMANVSPEIRARIQNLRVDPKMVTSLDSISGNVPAKKAIKSNIFLASSLPHLVMEGLGSRGILLHGPPGTGKTLLALASATQSEKYTVYSALSSDLIVKWQGSSEQNIAGLFAIAQENAPAAIFIDEVEGLCQSRTSTSYDGNLHRISNVFLASMTMAKGVVLIGTTNLPWRLNQAFGRRFRTKVHVGLPSEDDRRSIVQRRLISFNHSLSESDVVDFAKSCKNFTGDVVTQSINAALEELAEEIESATHFRPVSSHPCPLIMLIARSLRSMEGACTVLAELMTKVPPNGPMKSLSKRGLPTQSRLESSHLQCLKRVRKLSKQRCGHLRLLT